MNQRPAHHQPLAERRVGRLPASAQTAFGPMVIAAAEQYTPPRRRLVDDEMAIRILPPAARLTVRACGWQPVRDLLVRATERTAPGMWGSMLCRKRYADDAVTDAVTSGIRQVVILGAGLDTRGYRLVTPAGADAFEVDQPANAALKTRRLEAAAGGIPERMHVIPVDFETDDLATALAGDGFEVTRPALFVWEAVTQYLTENAVRGTFAFLADAAPGSRLIFTYIRTDFLDGTHLYGARRLRERMTGRYAVWKYGLHPHEVGPLLHEYGWDEREQVGPAEYTARYLDPVGRRMPISEIERFVHAIKS